MHSTLKTVFLALLLAHQALSKPVVLKRAIPIVDDITCNLISKHLEDPTSIVAHLMRRSPASTSGLDADELSNILVACGGGSVSDRHRKLPGNSNDDGEDDGALGNGQYPPFGNTANSAISGGGAGAGAGSGAGAGAGTAAAASNSQSTKSLSSEETKDGKHGGKDGKKGGKLPFNPTSAPNTITRREELNPAIPPAASSPTSAVPASGASGAGDKKDTSDITDEGFQRGSLPKQSLADAAQTKRPTGNTKSDSKNNDKAEGNTDTKCVGQAGTITCGLQSLGL